MTKEIKYMDFDEFRELGLLQEVNRKFFHPLGLALEININEETHKAESFGKIWDYRNDPEGIFFGKGMIEQKKIDNVEKLRQSKLLKRSLNKGLLDIGFRCDLDGIQIK